MVKQIHINFILGKKKKFGIFELKKKKAETWQKFFIT